MAKTKKKSKTLKFHGRKIPRKKIQAKKKVKTRKKILVRKKVRKVARKIKATPRISAKKAVKVPRKVLKKRNVRPASKPGNLSVKTLPQKRKPEPAPRVEVKPIVSTRSQVLESFKPKIKVIGIGGGGGSIVSEIGRSLEKATFVIADTDVRAFKKRQGIKHFLFGQELTHGLGTGLNTDLARDCAQKEKSKISELFVGQDIVIFITCLGGGLGSGATQVFLNEAKNFGGITLGIFTLPFRFEGKAKQKIAIKALRELRPNLNVSITIPNERIFKIIDENTAITEAFSMVNKSLIESLESLIDLIQSPGLINIDFADLRAVLQGKGNLAFLNTAEASGKDKAEEVIKGVLHNPLYQDNFLPEKVLFNIEGGKTLSMFEVDKISKAISEKNSKAKIIFGISRNPKYKNKVKTTLLMTGPMPRQDIMREDEAPKDEDRKGSGRNKTKKSRQKAQSNPVAKKKISILDNLLPVFGQEPEVAQPVNIVADDAGSKKNLRRTALEIKRAEEMESNKKTKQEEEWEIPAFLRFKKVK